MERSPLSSSAALIAQQRFMHTSSEATSASRKALSGSISAAALLESAPSPVVLSPSASMPRFDITSLLVSEANSVDAPRARTKQKNQSSFTDTTQQLPLSPIRQVPLASSSRPSANAFADKRAEKNQRDGVKQQQPIATTYLERLDDPENTELFAYSSTLCHRITGRYLPKAVLQRDPTAQKHEIERIQRDPEILYAIDTIRTLSTQFKDVARDTMGHRKELGHALFRIEENYLKLFEKLMEISLRMYWKYEQEREGERAADKASITHWKELHAWKKAEYEKLQKLLAGNAIVLKTQQIQIHDLEKQLDEVTTELTNHRDLELHVRELTRVEDELRARERSLQGDLERLQMRGQHKRLVDEMKTSIREKDALIVKQDTAIRELSVQLPPVLFETTSTQTEVDDDGLWDVQDGIPRYVSKSARHKMMWRRFHAFVTCRNCRGKLIVVNSSNRFAGDNLELSRADEQEFIDLWSVGRQKKRTKKETKRIEQIEQHWQLPPPIMLFLSNLPKSAMAFPFYPLEHMIPQIEEIYDDKFTSDQVDASDGVAREEFPKFICEFFLKTHGLRQHAEIALYRLLISVKNCYRRSSHVKLFARFLNLLHDRESQQEQPPSGQQHAADTPQAVAATTNKRNGYLNLSFLHVFLTARYYLLRPPPAVPITTAKARKQHEAAASGHNKPPDPHVLQVEPTKKWVTLDHAIYVLKWFIAYLSEDSVVSYCREVEYSTAIYMGGALTEVSGNRLAVRAEMRRAMLTNSGTSGNNTGRDDPRNVRPRIVADVHKVLVLLVDALEHRQEVMAKDLVALFDAGDTNHDCVLSFAEFKAIIHTRVSHFSDRRILRMFREALMGGTDQSFALSMEAFVLVCSDHGLVSLIPDDRLQDPFQHRSSKMKKKEQQRGKALSEIPSTSHGGTSEPSAHEKDASTQSVSTVKEAPQSELLGGEIPEELPFGEGSDDAAGPWPTSRAEEVEDEDVWEW